MPGIQELYLGKTKGLLGSFAPYYPNLLHIIQILYKEILLAEQKFRLNHDLKYGKI